MKKYFLCAVLIFVSSSRLFPQSFSITIDAVKDAFYESLNTPADGHVFIPSRAHLLDVGTAPDDDVDISGRAWFSYDNDYLYCYFEVVDDIVLASNSSRFNNDCVELKFDPDPEYGEGAGTSNCRITAKGADNAENPDGVDNLNGSGHLEDQNGVDYVVADGDYARRLTDDGYIVEFRVPFLYINEQEDGRFIVDRNVNNKIGMAINIGDNDATTRDHMLQWSAGFSDAAHSNADLLGTVTFLEGNKVKLEAVSPRDPSIVNDSADVWYTDPDATGIEEISGAPSEFNLFHNYPNPFNPNTTIKFSLPASGYVSLKIYNNLGQEVAQLVNQEMKPGTYSTEWDAAEYSSGTYFYRLTAGSFQETKKLTLLK